jgi:hypothetical protein
LAFPPFSFSLASFLPLILPFRYIQDFEMRLPWIIQLALNVISSILSDRPREITPRGEGHTKTEAEKGVMGLTAQAGASLSPPHSEFLISDFWSKFLGKFSSYPGCRCWQEIHCYESVFLREGQGRGWAGGLWMWGRGGPRQGATGSEEEVA